MTLPGQVTFDNEEEREDWIKGRTRGFSDVYPTSDQLRGDLELLFAKELFGYGPARGVNMTKLRKVLGENRDRLLPGPQADDARRAVAFDDKVGTHRPENEASVINRLPLTAFTVIIVALLSVTTHAAGQEYSAQLTGSAVVPPVSSAATGVFVATLDTQTRTFSYTLEFKGLSSSEGSAYIQGPAAKGTNAAMAVFPISKAGVPLPASPIRATVTLTDSQMKELQSNLWYVEIHTSAFPNGEIRGQIMKKLKPAKGAAGKQK